VGYLIFLVDLTISILSANSNVMLHWLNVNNKVNPVKDKEWVWVKEWDREWVKEWDNNHKVVCLAVVAEDAVCLKRDALLDAVKI
jgi:hypothetical protein